MKRRAAMTGCLLTATLLAGRGAPGAADEPAPASAPAPAIYGAGLFSTGAWDFFMAFSADQRYVLFCRANDDFSSYEIFETRREGAGRWRRPSHPGFAGQWSDADPHLTADGKRVFFISNRPGPGESAARTSYDIFVAERGPAGEWGEPRRLPAPINAPHVDEWSPSVAANGNLYFGSERPGGPGALGAMDLWVARWKDGGYGEPENLGPAVNTAANEVEPWVAPDESYLVFSARDRSDGVGRYDLFISRRDGGAWQAARLLGHGVNTPQLDLNPSVSPDGRWLYFSSTRPRAGDLGERFDSPPENANVADIGNGKGDIYRIALSELAVVSRPDPRLDPERRR